MLLSELLLALLLLLPGWPSDEKRWKCPQSQILCLQLISLRQIPCKIIRQDFRSTCSPGNTFSSVLRRSQRAKTRPPPREPRPATLPLSPCSRSSGGDGDLRSSSSCGQEQGSSSPPRGSQHQHHNAGSTGPIVGLAGGKRHG